MTEEYAVAAMRHYRDARSLQAERRSANADQLFGFAAECAIKKVLAELPGFGQLPPPRKHVNELWPSVHVHRIPRRYANLVRVLKQLPHAFSDWSTDQRYGADDIVSQAAVDRHHNAAKRVLGSVGLIGTRRGD